MLRKYIYETLWDFFYILMVFLGIKLMIMIKSYLINCSDIDSLLRRMIIYKNVQKLDVLMLKTF